MDRIEIVWTEEALEEFAQIVDFYAARNKSDSYGIRLKKKLNTVLALIRAFPRIGKISEDGETCVFAIDKFLLLYTIDQSSIFILSFWDPKQYEMKRVIHPRKTED